MSLRSYGALKLILWTIFKKTKVVLKQELREVRQQISSY